MLTVATVISFLEEVAPPALAAAWDNVGLLLGDRAASVRRVMTCLTVTPESAAEAIQSGAQLIVTHHPILFRGTKRLTTDTSEGRMLLELVRSNVAVYSPHTGLDDARNGINDAIAARLGLRNVVPLRRHEIRQCKVVVFVPENDLEKVSSALFSAGAGKIGEYSECSFRLGGLGTFRGSEKANPTVGQKGRRETVPEWRLEVICPESRVEAVLSAMRAAHSYEEPAFDVYPLRPTPSPLGTGRIGELIGSISLAAFASIVKDKLRAPHVQVVGNLDRPVRRVAIVCGAGGELFGDAVQAQVDVFLTGEMRFHDYLTARAQDLALVLPGHFASESFVLEDLALRIKARFPELEVEPSRRESDPVIWV